MRTAKKASNGYPPCYAEELSRQELRDLGCDEDMVEQIRFIEEFWEDYKLASSDSESEDDEEKKAGLETKNNLKKFQWLNYGTRNSSESESADERTINYDNWTIS